MILVIPLYTDVLCTNAGLFDSHIKRRSEKEESLSIFHIIIWILLFLCICGGNDGVEEGERSEICAISLKPGC